MMPISLAKARRPKYGNKACRVGDEHYRSGREMARHQDLLILERAGQISELKREVPFVLAPAVRLNGRLKPPLRYFADFVYRDKNGLVVVEDAKGMRTDVYRIKRHLMATVLGVEVIEV